MSGRLGRAAAEALLKALSALGAARRLYPPGHGATRRARQALAQVVEAVFARAEPVLVAESDGYLVVGDLPFLDTTPQAGELLGQLRQRGVEGFILHPGVCAADVERFYGWLCGDGAEPWEDPFVSVTRVRRDEEVWRRARQAYGTAVEALEEAYREVQGGRIPDGRVARACVRTFAELLAESPSVLGGLALIKDYDRYTFHHSVNVCLLALGLGRRLRIAEGELEALGIGALLHDIGKTRTPPELVRKAGRLSAREWEVMCRHPELGRELVGAMGGIPPPAPRVVHEHHMRLDGGGYPARPPGHKLCALTPLVTAADVYDAMTTHRPYSKPVALPEAVRTVAGLRGTQLDSRTVEAFLSVVGRIPVGSTVRLRSGEVAVVSRLGASGEPEEAIVVVGADGTRRAPAAGRRPLRPEDIAGWVDPLVHGVDPVGVVNGR
ncbi:MAG: HD domain-containing protein [Deferrisomatales bacterium]